MIEVVKFTPEHLDRLDEQEATAYLRPYLRPEHVQALAAGQSYTALAGERVVACAGVVEHWPGRGEAWAYLDRDCRRHFLAITNAVRRFLDVCPLRRVEAVVDVEFPAGHRWVRALGFALEAPRMAAYRPDGGDCALYARVR